MAEKWQKKLSVFFRGWGLILLVALLIATSFRSAIADWNDIPSGSMLPTILIGDRVFVNKLAYDLKIPYTTLQIVKWSEPKRGDIVVFYSPEFFIKKIYIDRNKNSDKINAKHTKIIKIAG